MKCRKCEENVPASSLCKSSTGGKTNLCKPCRRIMSQKHNKKKQKALKLWRSYYA